MRKGFVEIMRSFKTQSLLGLMIVTITACTSTSPSSSAQSTNAVDHASQPDLIVQFMYLEMEGRQGRCVDAYTPYGIRVQIKNIGSAATGSFFVDLNGAVKEVEDGLQVDQSIELHFAGTIPSGQYEAKVDPTDQVVESRENNNTSLFHAPTPTPPPLCTVTATATP